MSFLAHSWSSQLTGDCVLVTRNSALVSLDFADFAERLALLLRRRFGVEASALPSVPLPALVERALGSWLAGEPAAFAGLTFDEGGTVFQRTVWAALRAIPHGSTWSYAQLAGVIGNPKAVRAVARANALNPIGIITPCHRVIGSDGSLTGYAGGLARKQALLAHEGAYFGAGPRLL